MKYIKKVIHIFLSFLLILSTVIVYPVEAWATLPNVPGAGTTYVPLRLISLYETLRDGYNDGGSPLDYIKESIKNSGFLSPEIPALSDLSSLDQYITGNAPDLKGETPEETAKNVGEFIVNNTTVSDNSVSVNTNVKNFTKNIIDNYKSNSSYVIGYTYDLDNSTVNTEGLSALKQLCSTNQNNYYLVTWNNLSNVVLVDKNLMYLVTYDNNYFVNLSAKSTDQQIHGWVKYSRQGSNYVQDGNYSSGLTGISVGSTKDSVLSSSTGAFVISSGSSYEIPIFLNNSASEGTYINNHNNPYYYNWDTWNNYSTSEGDWTYTPTNINTVTYGDTVSYINDYHDTNNNYPDYSTVNNWIENTNEENITNNNGGGSGGDDSGGGSGSDDPTDIFGWLKQLGAVLGSLIKGVGEFLTEIVTGLVSAINSLLSGISDLIQNITESLPTVFMDFLGTLFSWLPDEWVALFSACVIFMLLWGIIKTIRGS